MAFTAAQIGAGTPDLGDAPLSLTPFLSITTDVQWIDEPSGDSSLRDVLVTGVRFEVTL